MIVAPSILSADFSKLKEQLDKVKAAGAQWIHFDVMDGHFVKNITFGTDILKAVKNSSSLFIDVHFVLSDPEYYASVFINSGADSITFHIDAINDVERTHKLIDQIHSHNVKVGVTLNPDSPLSLYEPFLSKVDIALVMSIVPGFGGQKFKPESIDRIKWLKEIREKNGYNYLIQVDGGINEETGLSCKKAGVDVLVAGSYVFGSDIDKAVKSLL